MWGEFVTRQLKTGTACSQVTACMELQRWAGIPRWGSDFSAHAKVSGLPRTLWANSGGVLTQMWADSRSYGGRQAQK